MKVYLEPGAKMPEKAHDLDAGYDLFSMSDVVIAPGEGKVIETGVHMEIPPGFCGLMVSKSGLNVKYNLTSTGLIDSGYTGAIKVKLYNNGKQTQIMKSGWKVSQIVILPIAYGDVLEQVDSLEEFESSERGHKGFGSSGWK